MQGAPVVDLVSIVIPTLERPQPLRRALVSALAQSAPDAAVEIIVVDNSATGSARATVETLSTGAGVALRYLPTPAPGIANARNAGVREASGRWIAFLDDDQEAAPGWLAAHVGAARASGADAVFGPVEARAEGGGSMGPFGSYFSRVIDRADASDVTDLSAYLGTNNSMFDKARCLSGDAPFDVALNATGGEDSLLLKRLALSGRKLAWAARADVVEWVPPRRLNWAYVRKRRFLSGQIRSFVLAMLDPPRSRDVAFWMAAGAAQFVGACGVAAAFAPFDRDRSQKALSIAYGGLGKVLWMKRFRPSLYGPGLVS